MYRTRGLQNSRIEVADALRGLAVAGIILYHSVEHFNLGYPPAVSCALPGDPTMFNILTVLLSGKMYGIFALLFGLSFFIMRDNQEQKGKDFSLRFFWLSAIVSSASRTASRYFAATLPFSSRTPTVRAIFSTPRHIRSSTVSLPSPATTAAVIMAMAFFSGGTRPPSIT